MVVKVIAFSQNHNMAKEPKGAYAEVAGRLIAIRRAMGVDKAQEFADLCQIPRTRYYQLEDGSYRVGHEYVEKIKFATGYSMDWIYTGDTATLSSAKLSELRAAEPAISLQRKAQQ